MRFLHSDCSPLPPPVNPSPHKEAFLHIHVPSFFFFVITEFNQDHLLTMSSGYTMKTMTTTDLESTTSLWVSTP